MKKLTALIPGGRKGMLGQALTQVMLGEGWATLTPGKKELDLFDQRKVEEFVKLHQVDLVANTVAYTDVDGAEEDQQEAFRLNRDLPVILGRACREMDICLMHYSTDFVFDGRKNTPYTTEDQTGALNIYGKSKLQGEKVLLDQGWDKLLIIRTAWLFGPFKTNFVHKILNLARKRKSIRIVYDQVGSPTNTTDLARYSLKLFKKQTSGVYHVVNKGQASWCELATESINSAGLNCRVVPIPSSEYPQKARRPAYSVLDCSKFSMVTGVSPKSWVQALRDYIYYYEDHA